MRITLIFPPPTDPRSAHLALAYLAAVLRRGGVAVEMLDLDLAGHLALLAPDRLSAAGKALREKMGSARAPGSSPLGRLVARAEDLAENAPLAIATLRHPEHFYDSNRYNAARETVFDALDLVSAAAPAGVHHQINPIRYDVDGVDPRSLADLVRVSADRGANLWADEWESAVYPALERDRPDLVGITITNRQQVIPGLILARALRERGHFVVLGGTVYTKFATRLARLPAFFEHFADGVVAYEGETAISALAEEFASGRRDLSRVPNLFYLEDGQVRFTRVHVEDVDRLPAPDFEGLPLSGYLAPATVLPILVGKGCYFNRCKFCDIPYINHVAKKAYRLRSPANIVADVLSLHRRFSCRNFEITDEALAPRLLVELAEAFEPHAGKGFSFAGYARLEPGFTPEVCRRVARMGMRKLFFGLESGDQRTLDHMEKGIRIENVRPVLAHCLDAGICFHLFSIVGFPEEDEESARNTFRFFVENRDLIDRPGNSFDIHPFGLELRTRYYEEAEERGAIVSRETIEKEFVLGLGSEEWTKSRGISHMRAEELIAESTLALRKIYRKWHAIPGQLWPGFEEYSILYADRYANRLFPYRTSLPDEADPAPFQLAWNPAALIEREGGETRVSSRWHEIRIDEPTYRLLGDSRPRTGRELLDLCANGASEGGANEERERARETIDALLSLRLLEIEVVPAREPTRDATRKEKESS